MTCDQKNVHKEEYEHVVGTFLELELENMKLQKS